MEEYAAKKQESQRRNQADARQIPASTSVPPTSNTVSAAVAATARPKTGAVTGGPMAGADRTLKLEDEVRRKEEVLKAAAAKAKKNITTAAAPAAARPAPVGSIRTAAALPARPALGASAAATAGGGLMRAPGATVSNQAGPKPAAAPAPRPTSAAAVRQAAPAPEVQYEISPMRDSDDSDDEDRPRKEVPGWARGPQLAEALQRQKTMDPDRIFQSKPSSCDLEEVFGGFDTLRPRKRDPTRRTSSGDWTKDKLSGREELAYRKAMGLC